MTAKLVSLTHGVLQGGDSQAEIYDLLCSKIQTKYLFLEFLLKSHLDLSPCPTLYLSIYKTVFLNYHLPIFINGDRLLDMMS